MTVKRCASCGGRVISQLITYDQHWGDDIFIFENVPAGVCAECDSVWLEGKTAEEMDLIVKTHPKPERVREVPVWSLCG